MDVTASLFPGRHQTPPRCRRLTYPPWAGRPTISVSLRYWYRLEKEFSAPLQGSRQRVEAQDYCLMKAVSVLSAFSSYSFGSHGNRVGVVSARPLHTLQSQSWSLGHSFCHFLGFPLLHRFPAQKRSLPPPSENPAFGKGSDSFHLYPSVPDGEKLNPKDHLCL